jgi:glutamine amidotransferase
MLAVVDSGVANLASVMAALQRLNAEAEITADPAVIARADRVIVPGVGAASAAMAQLDAKDLVPCLRSLTQPVLGICLGMQILFDYSNEGSGVACLGVLPGTVDLIPASTTEPVPHMGWNQLHLIDPNYPLLQGVPENTFVYFVHSFAVNVNEVAVASTDYGVTFTAVAARRNYMGCQFHPERSGVIGQKILRNFMGM